MNDGLDLWLAVRIYSVTAVFWGFVPLSILWQQFPAAVLQVLGIVAVVIGTWRKLTDRSFKLDQRIGLSLVAYVVVTALTNVVWWMLQHGAR